MALHVLLALSRPVLSSPASNQKPLERNKKLGTLNAGIDDSGGKTLEQQDKTQETNESSTFDLDEISSSAAPGDDFEASVSSTTAAWATMLLPLGNCVVVEVERATTGNGTDDVGDGGAAATNKTAVECKAVRLDDRVELVECRGEPSKDSVLTYERRRIL